MRAENKGFLDARTNAQLTIKHSKHSVSGQLLPKNRVQSNSNSVQNQSTLSHQKISTTARHWSARSTSKQWAEKTRKTSQVDSFRQRWKPRNHAVVQFRLTGETRPIGKKAFPTRGGTSDHQPKKNRWRKLNHRLNSLQPRKWPTQENWSQDRNIQIFQKPFLETARHQNQLWWKETIRKRLNHKLTQLDQT